MGVALRPNKALSPAAGSQVASYKRTVLLPVCLDVEPVSCGRSLVGVARYLQEDSLHLPTTCVSWCSGDDLLYVWTR